MFLRCVVGNLAQVGTSQRNNQTNRLLHDDGNICLWQRANANRYLGARYRTFLTIWWMVNLLSVSSGILATPSDRACRHP